MARALRDRNMGVVLRIFRRRTGARQTQVGMLVGLPQSHVSELERGRRQVVTLEVFERFADGLGIPRHRLGLALRHPDGEDEGPATLGSTVSGAGVLGELEEVTRRFQWLASPNITDGVLDQLDQLVLAHAPGYERSDAVSVYPAVRGQRRWVQELLTSQQHPRQRTHLFVLAGQLSALLGYLAYDAGHERLAYAYCDEAFSLAETVGDRGLMAWVRGTESFIAYYQGRDRKALDLARDGQRYARGGLQSVRLAISGEARAAGRLGDRAGVDDAVRRAFRARDRLAEDQEVSDFLSFGPYSTSRVAGNAASAHLAVGAPDEAREQAQAAIPVFDAHRSRASRALTRTDLAMALLATRSPEPERAGALMAEALETGADLTSNVVARRAGQFLAAATRFRHVPEIASVQHGVKRWQRLDK